MQFVQLGGRTADELAAVREDLDELRDAFRRTVQLSADPFSSSAHMARFRCIGTFTGHQDPVWSLAVHEGMLFSGSADKTIRVWDTKSPSGFKVIRTLTAHDGLVLALKVYEDKLYSGSHDRTVKVWNIDTFEVEATLGGDGGHDEPVSTLAVDNGLIYSGSRKVVYIWDIHTHAKVGQLNELQHWVRALVTSPQWLFTGSFQEIAVWPARCIESADGVPKRAKVLRTSGGSIYSMCITKDLIICGTNQVCAPPFQHTCILTTFFSNEPRVIMMYPPHTFDLRCLDYPGG